jgi:hypothetical protein
MKHRPVVAIDAFILRPKSWVTLGSGTTCCGM